jgi:hypothetical protein
MQLTNILALVALLATGALAAPGHQPPAPPPKPSPPTVKQSNFCGNGVTPYCCDNGSLFGGFTSCVSIGMSAFSPSNSIHSRLTRHCIAQGATCDTTIVCCNANDVCTFLFYQTYLSQLLTPTNPSQSIQVCLGNTNVNVN